MDVNWRSVAQKALDLPQIKILSPSLERRTAKNDLRDAMGTHKRRHGLGYVFALQLHDFGREVLSKANVGGEIALNVRILVVSHLNMDHEEFGINGVRKPCAPRT